ncbi:S8 family serine peptidase [Shewanella sp. TC10]|uniref:S8 family serine peptidase n=1 Tax=Shewanella sp. TC10 TaxID=1419739 RepID=UPI00129DEB27|nr:S8 family serine peptidase [Shewanella sp. TC10]
MQLKKISLMTIAAIYAAGAGAASIPSQQDGPLLLNGIDIVPVDISNEEYQRMQDVKNNALNRPGLTTGPNQHRAINTNAKTPFHIETDLAPGEHTYIIQLSEQPVATYDGSIAGYSATAPVNSAQQFGKQTKAKINTQSSASRSYVNYLQTQQASIQSEISSKIGVAADIRQSYQYAFNGMSMQLTQAQAAKVASLSGVKAVTRSVILELHTDVGPQHIGADQIWNGNVTAGTKFTGAGIKVGILDTGINSNHPSFTAMGDDGVAIVNPLGSGNFVGDCELEEFTDMCNDKLIGIRSYAEITDTYGDPVYREQGWWADWERARPANGEDYNGHGSHTASTVAGNVLFDVAYQVSEAGYGDEINGRDTNLVFPRVSGVAPHANIISYQVCWAGGQGDPYAGCPQETTLKAIDDAIADGVDVINYSIGGSEQFPWIAPTELAFLAAREAGISVATSAGNAGEYWMDHVSPWVTSVAASTHGRVITSNPKTIDNFEGGDENPSPYGPMRAASITGAYAAPVVLAADYNSENAACDTPFDANTFTAYPDGNPLTEMPIVVCQRSDQPRAAKADNILSGGAGGMILYNIQQDWEYPSPEVVKVEDFYSVPTAHIGAYDGGKVVTWLSSGTGHRASLSDASLFTEMGESDLLADFSSRGPSTTNPNVMAPTVAAPGVDVFAAYANDRIFTLDGFGMNWAAISGTSMASPHVAGAMALIKNAHPNWTPAEIQSALTTTTTEAPFTFDQGGAGVINVAAAVNATLVLDESVENYTNANPMAGGDVTSLNTPYIVNRECKGTCNWFRTVTATEDGSWNVSAEEIGYTGASLLELTVSPANFSLQAGETQRIMLTAKMPDVDYQSDSPLGAGNTDGLTLYGKLNLTPTDSSKPIQTLPVITTNKKADIPVIVEAEIAREQGSMVTPNMILPSSAEISATVYGLTQGEQKEYHLSQNQAWPWDIIDSLPTEDSQIGYRMFTVPEGTKRLVVEITEEDNIAKFSSRLDLGRDVNNDGNINWEEEAICISDWRMRDYCAINNPEPGQYWYMVSNLKFSIQWEDPYDRADRIVTNVVMVSDDVSSEVSIDSIDTNGFDPVSLGINWNMPDAESGDIYHGVVALGTDSANLEDIGLLPLRLTRASDEVELTSSHTGAKVGDVVDFEIVHGANLNGLEREMALNIALPEGMTLMPDSVRGNEFFETLETTTDGNQVVISGLQTSSKDAERRYEYTTSLEDEMCRLPFSDATHFLDLPSIGVPQLPGFDSEWSQMFEIPDFVGADNYFPHIPLYGVERKDTTNIITIQGDGLLRFDAHAVFATPGDGLIWDGARDLMIAPFWHKGGVTINESGVDFATFTPYEYGVYAAALNQNQYLAVQWKRMYASTQEMFGITVDKDTHYNFTMLASADIDFTPNVYEIMFSYEEMNQDKGAHTVGLKGYQGVRGFYYPVNGYHFDEYAVNQPEKLASNMVICANYQGPESTRLVTRFSAKVNSAAIGSNNEVTLTSELTNSNTVTKTASVPVGGNITVFDIANHTMAENEVMEGLSVEYMHSENRAVAMMASGENVSIEVDGMSFNITPDTDWHGETEITVTVMDSANQHDQASTSFMLTVNSDGIDAAPPAEEAPEETPAKSDSGGSMGILSLILVGLLGAARRRKLH